jgi:hypothetical protein
MFDSCWGGEFFHPPARLKYVRTVACAGVKSPRDGDGRNKIPRSTSEEQDKAKHQCARAPRLRIQAIAASAPDAPYQAFAEASQKAGATSILADADDGSWTLLTGLMMVCARMKSSPPGYQAGPWRRARRELIIKL